MIVISVFAKSVRFICRNFVYILAFFWILGILAGILYCSENPSLAFLLMRSVFKSPVSIVGSIFSVCFPLCITAIAVYLKSLLLVGVLSAVKGFGLGYCIYAIAGAFGSAGWLIAVFLLFPDLIMAVYFFGYWSCREGNRLFEKRYLWMPGLYLASFCVTVELLCVSPFIQKLCV